MNAGSYFLIAGLALTSSLQLQASINSPENYPAEYKKFLAALDQQLKDQSYDYFEAMKIALSATRDELCSLEWIRKAAEEKKPAAMYFNANWERLQLQQKRRAEVNEEVLAENHKLFVEAADLGFIPAIVQVAIDYVTGTGVKKDRDKGLAILAEASRDGNFIARYRWLKLTDRLHLEEDLNRPEVQSEIKRGNHLVMYEAAVLCQDKNKRFEYLTMAADAGSATAYNLRYLAYADINPKQSMSNAFKGAELHSPELMATVGGWLIDPKVMKERINRDDFPHNPAEGLQFIQLASMMGNDYANEILGNFYLKGLYGVAKNEKRSFEHFKRGSLMKSGSICHLCYAHFLVKGIGCEPDYKEATRHLVYLSHMKYFDAPILIAYMHYKGLGVERNVKKVESLLQEHALSYPIAYAYIALLKREGDDPQKPDTEAAEHYLRLAELMPKDKGITRAIYNMSLDKGDWIFTHMVSDEELAPYYGKKTEK